MIQNQKYFRVGLTLFFGATFVVLGYQNCGSSVSQLGSSTTSASSAVTACAGTYTITTGSSSGTLTFSEDTSGNISGTLSMKGVNGAIAGNCTSTNSVNNISFTRTISPQYQIMTGTLTQNYGINAWKMTGTYTTCTNSGCDAGTNTWSAQ
jgi:hypothetical protein